MYSVFDINWYLTLSKGLSLPRLLFPQLQIRQDAANDNFTSKQCCNKDGGKSIFARSKKQKQEKKTLLNRHAISIWCLLALQRKLSDLERLKNGIDFRDLFWNCCTLYLIFTLKQVGRRDQKCQ